MKLKIRRAVLLTCATLPAVIWAQTDSESTGVLNEVVITAQKRTERLSDVPVSAAVVAPETMANSNAGDISDLNRLVPSVMLSGSINGRVPTGMRGISSVSNESTIGISSGVAIMIDGVPVPSDSRAGNNLDDAQNVEVLKGPQATLGGRTAAAGVINVVTRGPSDVLTGDVSLLATDDDEYRVNGFIGGPIADAAKYSLAAYYTTRDYPLDNSVLGKTTNQEIYGARGKLLFQPSENLDITLMARVARDESDGANFVYTHLSPGAYLLLGTGLPPFGLPGGPREFLDSVLSQRVLVPGVTANFDNQTYTSAIMGSSKVEDTDYSVDFQYRIGDLTLGSTTAYQHEKQDNVQDLFLNARFFWNNLTNPSGSDPTAPPPFFNAQTTTLDIKQLSEELKLVSPADRTFSYLVGLFYSDTKVRMLYDRPLVPAWQLTDTTAKTKTTDVYARGTWKLTDTNSLVAGLRYNYDELEYHYSKISFPPPPVTQVLTDRNSDNQSTAVGDLSLQHRFANGTMAYLTYARGYSPAAYNTAYVAYVDDDPATPYSKGLNLADKMDIDHFELGSKGAYLDNRLSVNAAVFYTKYKKFQVQIFDASSVSLAPPLQLANAGGAETKGVEIDLQLAATDRLRFGLNAAYIDAEFTDYHGAPCYYPDVSGIVPAGSSCFQDLNNNKVQDAGEPVAGQPVQGVAGVVQDLSGKRMPISPKLKLVLSAEQSIPVGAGRYEAVLGANYSWRDEAQMLVDQNPHGIQPSFGILNLNVGLRKPDSKLSVTAFVNNVLDEHYFTDLEDFWSAPWGGVNTIIGQPARDTNRYFGLRVNVGF